MMDSALPVPDPLIAPVETLPDELLWLCAQPSPVIGYGSGRSRGADVVVADLATAEALAARVKRWPIAALALVQVLRSTEQLSPQQGLDLESFAYATLQAGPEFDAWLKERGEPVPEPDYDGDAVLLRRDSDVLEAVLNRPTIRNPISVEVREGLLATLELLELDDSIRELRVRGAGACFSVGGHLNEFGTLPDAAVAHWVRTVRSPARMLAKLGQRTRFYIHGACIGSGIELPAFGRTVVAHSRTFFQMPELSLGLIPGAGGTVSMTRRIGRQRLAWFVLSGRRINARTALEWGLVDELRDEPAGQA